MFSSVVNVSIIGQIYIPVAIDAHGLAYKTAPTLSMTLGPAAATAVDRVLFFGRAGGMVRRWARLAIVSV